MMMMMAEEPRKKCPPIFLLLVVETRKGHHTVCVCVEERIAVGMMMAKNAESIKMKINLCPSLCTAGESSEGCCVHDEEGKTVYLARATTTTPVSFAGVNTRTWWWWPQKNCCCEWLFISSQ